MKEFITKRTEGKKIYWETLIWNCVVLPWLKLIHRHKSAYWRETNGIYWRMWTAKQWAGCDKAMASFLPELDDVVRKVTAKDSAVTTVISTSVDQKTYKDGKVIAVGKTT